jgi:phosphohistidine phosphatase
LLVVGHNPGLEGLTTRLCEQGDASALARLGGKFPTGTLATLDITGPWAELEWGQAYLVDLVFPRDLPIG